MFVFTRLLLEKRSNELHNNKLSRIHKRTNSTYCYPISKVQQSMRKEKEYFFKALNTTCLTYFCGKSTALSWTKYKPREII